MSEAKDSKWDLGKKWRVPKLYKFLDLVNYEASSFPILPLFGYMNQ